MAGFVITDYLHNIPEARIGRQVPVIYCNLRCWYIFVPPIVDFFQVLKVSAKIRRNFTNRRAKWSDRFSGL
jgi:hypothetical protein